VRESPKHTVEAAWVARMTATATARTLRGLRAARRLLKQPLRLEVIREQAGGMEETRSLLAVEGCDPLDIDAVLELFGIASVGDPELGFGPRLRGQDA
jgi:hypothetical protein